MIVILSMWLCSVGMVHHGQILVYGSCEEFFLGRCKDGVLFILCILLLLLFSDLLVQKVHRYTLGLREKITVAPAR